MRALLFDLDGTLCDTLEDIRAAANRVLARSGIPALPSEFVRANVGRGARSLLQACLADTSLDPEECLREFRADYARNLLHRTAPYPGVREGLERLSGFRKAVVTNKPVEMSVAILQGLGLSRYFEHIVGEDSYPVLKPDPLPVLETIRKMGLTPAQAVLIGDSRVDVECARNAGVRFVGVTYGFGRPEELSGADATFDSFRSLSDWLLSQRTFPDTAQG